jgi:hypothetical protein
MPDTAEQHTEEEPVVIVEEVVELVPAGSERGVLRELVLTADEATLESVTLGAALFAGMEFAKPRVRASSSLSMFDCHNRCSSIMTCLVHDASHRCQK